MPDDTARQSLADQLLALPTPELVDVLRRVLQARRHSANGIDSCLVLAEINWESGKAHGLQNWEDWQVAAVAWPDREHYEGGFGPEPELWESGRCGNCGIEVVSTAKVATCPICATTCYLT